MTAKEIYERIDLSQLPKEKADKLLELEVKTKGFSIQNDRVDESMRNLYTQLKEKKPSALKDLKVEIKKGSVVIPYAMDKYGEFIVDKVFKNKSGETSYTGKFKKSGESREFILHSKDKVVKESEEIVGKRKVTKKNPTPSSSKKETITEVAKKIRKEGEEWRQALKRAGEEMRKRDDEASKQVKTELQKLIDFVKNDPNFKDFPRTYGKGRKDIDILKDASEKALAPGRRVSKKGHMNQYGASKGGRKYTENRDNRSDREASKFPKNIFLAKGGSVHRAELMEEGGEVFVPVQILANNPDALVNTATMNELFAKGGITTPSLFKLQDEVWEKFKFESGAEIKSTQQNRMKFSKAMDEALKSRGVAKESLSKGIFEKLEDENAHTLNEFLILNDYYQPSVWPEGKKFYFDRFKENPRGGLGKDGIVDGKQKAVKTTSKGYTPHDAIKLVIIKNPNENGAKNYLTINGSDVLNGVYDSSSFKEGGTIPSGYKYIRRGDVSQVVTKKNEIIFKPKNGFFVKKEALVKAGMNETKQVMANGEIEKRALELFNTLKEEGKLKRYYDTRGNGVKYFETIVPNRAEKGYYKRYESAEKGSIGVLQNEYLDKNDVLNYLKKSLARLKQNDKMADGGEVFVPVQIDANNPNALVQTTTMSELFKDGGLLKGRNNETGESFGVVIGSAKQSDEGLALVVRKSYGARISSFQFRFDENGNLKEILDYGYSLDGIAPDTKTDSGSGTSIFDSDKSTSIKEMAKLTSPAFAKKLYDFVQKQMLGERGMMAKGGRVMPFLKFEYATEARKKLDTGQLPVFDGGIGFDYLEKEKKLYYLPSVTGDWEEVGEFKSKKESIDWLSEQLKMEGFADGGVMAKRGMVVTSIKDIPNFKQRLEEGKITYRGLGMGKLFDDFYDLAGESGTRIKVDGKEYFITDTEFDTFYRDADGRIVVRFDAPYRKGYADGGMMDDDEGVDLFEDYEDQPEEVQAILAKYELEDNDYNTLNDLQAELEEIGYTFEFDLDAEPYDLRKIGQKGKSEFYAKGGYVDLQAKLMKELQKLQRDLNSQRLSQYTEGDNSEEEMARQRERASKLARFNEILDLLRELESKKMAEGGPISEDISECKKLVSAFCKEFGEKFGLDEEKVLKEVKFQDYLGHGASVFIFLTITSNVTDLKVGETKPNRGYIKISSDINPSGITGKDDIARTYVIDIELKGDKRYTQRKTEEGRYFKSYHYGRTIDDVMDATDSKIIYDLSPLEKKDDLKFKMSGRMADGGSIPEGYHQMPDGSIMADSMHMAQGGSTYQGHASYLIKADNPYQFINGAVAVLGAYSEDENIESGVKTTLKSVKKDLEGLRTYFFSIKDKSVNKKMADGGKLEILQAETFNTIVSDVRQKTELSRAEIYSLIEDFETRIALADNKSKSKFKVLASFDGYDLIEAPTEKDMIISKNGKKVGKLTKISKYLKDDIKSFINIVKSGKMPDGSIMADSMHMAKGGSLEAQSLEMAQNVSVQIAHHAIELKDALNGKTYVEPWVTSMLQRAADNLSDATHYLEGKEEKMAKGGKIREFDDVLVISKNKLGMVEAIGDNIYYVTTPFGETIEATMDDLQKIVSFKEGGDVKIGEIAMIAKENNATGDEVVKKISAGADVEMEHTEDRKVAMRIASDHLKEDFNYYEKLRKAGL